MDPTTQTAPISPGLRTLSLTKGIEEEVYAGTADGRVLPLSPLAAEGIPGFRCEPDGRNIEFSVGPTRWFDRLIDEFYAQRRRLREFLAGQGPYTLIPGASLSLGDTSEFCPVDRSNPYYAHIEKTWGTTIATAGMHVNLGVENLPLLFRAARVLRCEASLFLALSAGSPFLDGRATGMHSTRWHLFPRSPRRVPLFVDHAHLVAWMHEAVAARRIFNHRNLWLSVRANGPAAPETLDRLELRVCDRMDDPREIAAVCALMEWRVRETAADDSLDPLGRTGLTDAELTARLDANEAAAARSSLDAVIWDWETDREVRLGDRLERYLTQAIDSPLSAGLRSILEPIGEILSGGNAAMRWLAQYESGQSIEAILRRAIAESEATESEWTPLAVC